MEKFSFILAIGPLQLSDHHMTYFHKVMGCNFKNAQNGQNGQSMLKTSQWPSLKPLASKNEILWWFKFLIFKKLRRFYGKSCWRARPFSPATRCTLNFQKFKCINLLFNARDLKLGHFGIFDMLFPFLSISLTYSP